MRGLVVILALVSLCNAQQNFTITPGIAAEGWCDGFDMGPSGTATSAAQCFSVCQADYPNTIAVDFWPTRAVGNNCWCQDACNCTRPSLPDGGVGILYMANSAMKGPSCGYNLYMIMENSAQQGWCRGNDIALNTTINNQNQCYDECAAQHMSVAVDYWVRDGVKECFCQDECRCLSPSVVGGGDGYLALVETMMPPGDLCYNIIPGVGEMGWCNGFDMAPNMSMPTATTAAECYDNCLSAQPTTVAVDFWDIDHPIRNENNICWCQDSCPNLLPSKSDGGQGVLFIKNGTMKGPSTGYNMETVAEGNNNAVCGSMMTPATGMPANMYACRAQCVADGFVLATYLAYNGTCHCQMDCPCKEAIAINSGSGYLFEEAMMPMPPKCGMTMTCGAVRQMYKNHSCCGQPSSIVTFGTSTNNAGM